MLTVRLDPELGGRLRVEGTVGGNDEHLRGDAASVEAGPTEHVAFHDGDVPVGEVVGDGVARTAAAARGWSSRAQQGEGMGAPLAEALGCILRALTNARGHLRG